MMNKMVLGSTQFLFARSRCTYLHFLKKLSGICRNNICTKILCQLYAQGGFTNGSRPHNRNKELSHLLAYCHSCNKIRLFPYGPARRNSDMGFGSPLKKYRLCVCFVQVRPLQYL